MVHGAMRKRQFTPLLRNGRMIREGHFRRCKTCGKIFEMKSGNQKHCPDCSYYVTYLKGRVIFTKLMEAEPRLKAAADQSGNPRIWLAGEYSQKFLKGLIPAR